MILFCPNVDIYRDTDTYVGGIIERIENSKDRPLWNNGYPIRKNITFSSVDVCIKIYKMANLDKLAIKGTSCTERLHFLCEYVQSLPQGKILQNV